MSKKKEGFFSRRGVLKIFGGIAAIPAMGISFLTTGCFKGKTLRKKQEWPSRSDWDQLRKQVGGEAFHGRIPVESGH